MPRFFIDKANIQDNAVVITGADADHIKVLRLHVGDEITVCDGQNTDYRCKLTAFDSEQATAEIIEAVSFDTEPSVYCTILAGFPKGERADYIIQKCTECGASEIIFFSSKRCVAKLEQKNYDKKMARFRKIAEAAAKQSGRGMIPHISAVPSLEDALDIAEKSDLTLFMYETGERLKIRDVLQAAGTVSSAAIITGPEGGFEESEVELAIQRGIHPLVMGPRILRCETAPVVAMTALMYETNNL